MTEMAHQLASRSSLTDHEAEVMKGIATETLVMKGHTGIVESMQTELIQGTDPCAELHSVEQHNSQPMFPCN